MWEGSIFLFTFRLFLRHTHKKKQMEETELDGFKAEGMTTQRKHNADKQVRQLEYMLNK